MDRTNQAHNQNIRTRACLNITSLDSRELYIYFEKLCPGLSFYYTTQFLGYTLVHLLIMHEYL